MAFTVQGNSGAVPGANAYVTVAEMKSYLTDRGRASEYGTYSDTILQGAIVRATDYVDTRFRFVGTRQFDQSQLTQWPRVNAITQDGMSLNGVIPDEVKFATIELAARALTLGILAPDPVASATGALVVSSLEKVGPIEERFIYANGGALAMPDYPVADMMLRRRGLVRTGNDLRRA